LNNKEEQSRINVKKNPEIGMKRINAQTMKKKKKKKKNKNRFRPREKKIIGEKRKNKEIPFFLSLQLFNK